MKYNYDVKNECFVREDNLGRKIYINISEAQRIMTLYKLGYKTPEIRTKINFNSDKVHESTINTLIMNVEKGNIDLDGDYPAPSNVSFDLTLEERIDNLERDLKEFEKRLVRLEQPKNVSWRERLRL